MPIHPTAFVDPATRIDETAYIGPYAVIEGGVEIGARCRIEAHAVIRSGVQLGEDCWVDSHCVLGGLPQDLSFDPATPTAVRIGNGVKMREGVTVSRASKEGQFTEIEDGAFLMANSHVAHDCHLGTEVVLANGVLLAGHVRIGAKTFVGGGTAFHQFVRVGSGAMVGGMGRISKDVPPFAMVVERDEWIGLNIVGLKRQGKSLAVVRKLKATMRQLWHAEEGMVRAARAALESGTVASDEVREFLQFFDESKRGYSRPRRDGGSAVDEA